jgi:hypothetical protein
MLEISSSFIARMLGTILWMKIILITKINSFHTYM